MLPAIRKLRDRRQQAFTLIELAVVILICGVVGSLVAYRVGAFTFWKEEAFLRRLSETVEFLHHQAVADQAFYRIEFDFRGNNYSVGVLMPDPLADPGIAYAEDEVHTLSDELALLLSPSASGGGSLIPPPSFPSMADPQPLPENMRYIDVRTMRGKFDSDQSEQAYILFSPRGFSEFAVIHLRLTNGQDISILVNPFTGLVELRREYVDYEWSYGRNRAS